MSTMSTLIDTLTFPAQLFVHLESTSKSPSVKETIKPRNDTSITPPPTKWSYLCHPRLKEVQDEVDGYFLENWNFPSFKAVRTFLDAKFSEVTCLYFPLALDDRIHFACRLLTVLFLIDDVLEHMSFADGEAYNNRLIPISRGDVLPDRTKPEEFILYDLWESMRAHDKELADEVLEPTFVFMRSQTDRARLTIRELGHYLEYREKDVGKALLSALMRFSMGLRLSDNELQSMKALEANCAKQLSVVNDIYSYDKEEEAARTGHKEGAFLCSAVKVLAEEAKLGIPATKRVLWSMTREWEDVHDSLVVETIESPDGCSEAVQAYMKGLGYQMSGNEQWSKTTRRYN
ncbi:uncharacterized protein L3040_007997 [Drepanopeziza brunnea f. sp. 'multigermtubi']|uniref:Terpene synthase n=1 Tax=Marssonina brunnea f. sp. multigermtubi (strain MB_m1) TaxID=1072389 RepID=K1W9R9_MARBU|nr:uncharacterized protein MBM_07677 [Drepanopeziza brunnea f. sp. 'multigermtubi' MB_m1]EKD14000.1 hypothetical protein MBM_07677 [Drepanopeziza brunnea f. sp. 'multigermtubi' MB_m1]KAJ5035531.1 hypothetical protein L3040_007997 [Drepanopeziza brunnea f. sp. 'multigermtubi']